MIRSGALSAQWGYGAITHKRTLVALLAIMEAVMATSAPQRSWERPLVSLARASARPAAPVIARSLAEPTILDSAYAHSAAIAALHGRTFFAATRLLPPDKRRAMRVLYAFCRVSDDLVDHVTSDVQSRLAAWRRAATSSQPPPDDLVAVAWADVRARFQIPPGYAEQLIDGVARDLHQTRYPTFADLATYAYGVASTVGLMSMHIIGYAGEYAIPYAVKMGVALQVTNILRDVAEDRRLGRVYLPADELAAYGLREDDLLRGRVDERWRAFMRFQIARNRRLYAEAWPGIALLDADGRLAVAAACQLYAAILRDIESHDFDVFHRRAHVSAWGKLRRMPIIWLRVLQIRNGHDHL
jgi:phytoene synthase